MPTERYSKPNSTPLPSGQWETARPSGWSHGGLNHGGLNHGGLQGDLGSSLNGKTGQRGQHTGAERLLWLGVDRATLVSDARWLRQVSAIEVQIVSNAAQARAACLRGDPLACIVEFELSPGENGVRALEQLREQGMLAPAVLLTHTAELALATLAQSRLLEAVPVFSRAERHAQLREWLGDLQTCLSVPA